MHIGYPVNAASLCLEGDSCQYLSGTADTHFRPGRFDTGRTEKLISISSEA